MKREFTPQSLLRTIRWSVFAVVVAMVLWLADRFSFVEPTAGRLGMWGYSGRKVLIERLGDDEIPARGSVVCFHDSNDRIRLGIVVAVSGDALSIRDGHLWIEGERSFFPADGPAEGKVPPSTVIVAPDDATVLKEFGDPQVEVRRLVGRVLAELPF